MIALSRTKMQRYYDQIDHDIDLINSISLINPELIDVIGLLKRIRDNLPNEVCDECGEYLAYCPECSEKRYNGEHVYHHVSQFSWEHIEGIVIHEDQLGDGDIAE